MRVRSLNEHELSESKANVIDLGSAMNKDNIYNEAAGRES